MDNNEDDDTTLHSDQTDDHEDEEESSCSSRDAILNRIEDLSEQIFITICRGDVPTLFGKRFSHLKEARGVTSLVMVMDFVYKLLLHNRSSTTREVYYHFVTHFYTQQECENTIFALSKHLGVMRSALNLVASPKGWFCGRLKITRTSSGRGMDGYYSIDTIDYTNMTSPHGYSITSEWLDFHKMKRSDSNFVIQSDADFIIFVEKEGVYTRLSEDRFFNRINCILVTGKGVPDLATRGLVNALHEELQIPVLGVCDCNPYGLGVLKAIYTGSKKQMGKEQALKYSTPIRWLGLRPSQILNDELLEEALPPEVYQTLTPNDIGKVASLLKDPECEFMNDDIADELLAMETMGKKLELESLLYLGIDFISIWLYDQIEERNKIWCS